MIEEKNIELIKSIYENIGEGDIPTVLNKMDPDIEINFPGPDEIPFSGVYHGHEGFQKYANNLVENIDWENRKMEIDEMIAQDNEVVVLGKENLTARNTGRSWDTSWVMVWSIRNNKVKQLREFHDTARIVEAYNYVEAN